MSFTRRIGLRVPVHERSIPHTRHAMLSVDFFHGILNTTTLRSRRLPLAIERDRDASGCPTSMAFMVRGREILDATRCLLTCVHTLPAPCPPDVRIIHCPKPSRVLHTTLPHHGDSRFPGLIPITCQMVNSGTVLSKSHCKSQFTRSFRHHSVGLLVQEQSRRPVPQLQLQIGTKPCWR